jgi:hypothetical protein
MALALIMGRAAEVVAGLSLIASLAVMVVGSIIDMRRARRRART